jgi:nickel transport protein
MRIALNKTPSSAQSSPSTTLIVALFLLIPCEALAHKVNVFAMVRGDQVVVQGYFGGKAKAVDVPVEILGQDGVRILEGKTNAEGVWAFDASLIARKGDVKVVLHGGGGHRGEYVLKAPGFAKADEAPPQTRRREDPTQRTDARVSAAGVSGPATPPDQALTLQVVEDALEAKIAPLRTMLRQIQESLDARGAKGPGAVEILGGLGWIMGLTALGSYLLGRTRTEPGRGDGPDHKE